MTPAPDPLSPALVLTMGEPAGVGPDVTLRAWLDRASTQIPAFFCLADPDVLRSRAAAMGLKVAIERVSPGDAADCFPRALPVVPLEARAKADPGKIERGNGRAVIESIARGVGYVREGSASAIVTNPINKRALYDAGFQHPGHTEFLGALAGTWGIGQARPVMMLVGPDLRTVPVTIHIALSEVARTLTASRIVAVASRSRTHVSPWQRSILTPAKAGRWGARTTRSCRRPSRRFVPKGLQRVGPFRPTQCSTPQRARPTTSRSACTTTRR
jgi:4-hydroxythreonine-4-phosphate dehydrogenase